MENYLDKNHEVVIQPIGSFFEVDDQGYIINPAAQEKIQEEWKPVVEDVINAYREVYGDNVKNIYIRGSVAKGQAVLGVSDIDTFAHLTIPKEEFVQDWKSSCREKLHKKYPFIEDIELVTFDMNSKQSDVILNQSVLVYGLPEDFEKLTIGKELIRNAYATRSRIKKTKEILNKTNDVDDIKNHCVWAMKGLLRIGLEILLEKTGKYSRDLYPCYEIFSEYYPEKETDIREVLYLALNPTSDKKKILNVMDGIGEFLINESERILSIDDKK